MWSRVTEVLLPCYPPDGRADGYNWRARKMPNFQTDMKELIVDCVQRYQGRLLSNVNLSETQWQDKRLHNSSNIWVFSVKLEIYVNDCMQCDICSMIVTAKCRLDQVSAQMLGSFGYSAPEFAMSGLYTVKSDVYSFGVVMLELLTGRKPLDRYSNDTTIHWSRISVRLNFVKENMLSVALSAASSCRSSLLPAASIPLSLLWN